MLEKSAWKKNLCLKKQSCSIYWFFLAWTLKSHSLLLYSFDLGLDFVSRFNPWYTIYFWDTCRGQVPDKFNFYWSSQAKESYRFFLHKTFLLHYPKLFLSWSFPQNNCFMESQGEYIRFLVLSFGFMIFANF